MPEPSLWSLESVRVQERGRILGILESALQQIVSGADDLFRDPPKPGPHVSGGPGPKPGERTEADYLREEVREVKAAQNKLWRVVNGLIETVHGHASQLENVWQEIAALRPDEHDDECFCEECKQAEAAPPAQEQGALVRTERELNTIRAALKAEQAAHAETRAEIIRLSGELMAHDCCIPLHEHEDALAEARATARREGWEAGREACVEAAQGIASNWGDVRTSGTDIHIGGYQRAAIEYAVAALRALAPVAQKGGEDAEAR